MIVISLLIAAIAAEPRQQDTLDSCNWVYDANPDDGTYAGYYAINKNTPTDYCNYWQPFDGTGANAQPLDVSNLLGQQAPITSLAWYYECDNVNDEVVKYMCFDSTDCVDSGNAAGCFERNRLNMTEADFNCDDVSGSCLFEWASYLNNAYDENDPTNPAKCTASSTQKLKQIYGVNGGCTEFDHQGTMYYGLSVCSDTEALGCADNNPFCGYTIQQFDAADTACTGDDWGWISVHADTCGGQTDITLPGGTSLPGVFKVEQCSGNIEQLYATNGVIDNFSCDECSAEIAACQQDATCETFADYLLGHFPDCIYTFEAMEEGFIDPTWCTPPDSNGGGGYSDCSAAPNGNGFRPFYDCIKAKECYTQFVPGPEQAESNCTCDSDTCINDPTCAYAMGALPFDSGDDNPVLIWTAIYDICNGDTMVDDGTGSSIPADCTIFQPYLVCAAGCGGGDGDDDDDGCFNATMESAMFDCIFDVDCFPAFNATLGGFFGDDTCEEELCSPTELETEKTDYCNSNTCNDAFTVLYDAFYGCASKECVWQHCESEIDICKADADCFEELKFVIAIDNDYNPGTDDDFMKMIKVWYCSNRDGGQCTDKLESAFTCVETNDCLTLSDDQCYEEHCKNEVVACAGNDNCADALFTLIGNETQCERGISEMGGNYMYCPQECNDLDENNYSPCGTQNVPGTTNEVYNDCKNACDNCDNWLNLGRKGCGDGQCGDDWTNLMECILSECPDEDEDDDNTCISDQCTESFVGCLFTEECYNDWEWVENYFDTFDDRQDIDNEIFYQYQDEVSQIEGCSFDDLTGNDGPCYNVEFENSQECQTAAFTCYYYDIREYCKDVDENSNGCSINFWNMINCFFNCNWGVTDTIAPTPQPTTAQTTPVPIVDPNTGKGNIKTIGVTVVLIMLWITFIN